jgi:hypothetical protein
VQYLHRFGESEMDNDEMNLSDDMARVAKETGQTIEKMMRQGASLEKLQAKLREAYEDFLDGA